MMCVRLIAETAAHSVGDSHLVPPGVFFSTVALRVRVTVSAVFEIGVKYV